MLAEELVILGSPDEESKEWLHMECCDVTGRNLRRRVVRPWRRCVVLGGTVSETKEEIGFSYPAPTFAHRRLAEHC